MKRKYIVEVDDENEVLMKYTIESGMNKFYGRVVQISNYVCNTPLCTEEQRKVSADVAIEDAVYSTLHDGTVSAVYEVLVSPIKVENYLNGEYDEKFNVYLGEKIREIVEKFCPSK